MHVCKIGAQSHYAYVLIGTSHIHNSKMKFKLVKWRRDYVPYTQARMQHGEDIAVKVMVCGIATAQQKKVSDHDRPYE